MFDLADVKEIAKNALKSMAPRPQMEIWRWAELYRILGKDITAKPGRYRLSTAPYQKEPQDSFRDPDVIATVLYWASRLGKTEIVMNGIGYTIAHDPQSILVVYPTEDSAEKWSKKFFVPMANDTPLVGEKLLANKGRDGGNTILNKGFFGGTLSIIGSNSPSKFRQVQAPFVFCDEIDAMEDGEEGDPVDLAFVRAKNFRNSIKILSSTPTIKDESRIERWYEMTDQRNWFVPCRKCGTPWVMMWKDVDFSTTGTIKEPVIICPHCGATHTDKQRQEIIRNGHWKPTADFNGYRGYWLNGLNSLFPGSKGFISRLHETVEDFLKAKRGGMATTRTFVNTTLCETWEEKGETVDDSMLYNRREKYFSKVPRGGLLLTAGVDTQPDRLEVEVLAHGAGEESWSIDYRVIYGDPNIPENLPGSPWKELAELKREAFKHEGGFNVYVDHICIDSGGSNTTAVYEFCKKHKGQRFFAIKGRGGEDIPIIGGSQRRKFSKKNRRPVDLYIVGVDQVKDLVYSRLALEEEGPGYCHFPSHYSVEYFKQLTAEKKVVHYVKGKRKREWVKPEGRRNEALDCRVYAYAAMVLAAPKFDRLAYRLFSKQIEEEQEGSNINALEEKNESDDNAPKKKRTRKRKSSYVRNW
jgi:phage terminase large subunit GpA-like protein